MMFLLGLLMVGVVYLVIRELEGWNDRQRSKRFQAEWQRRQEEEAARPDSDVTWRGGASTFGAVCSLCEESIGKGAPVFFPNWVFRSADRERLILHYGILIDRLKLCYDCFGRIALCDPAAALETHELKVRRDWVDTVGKPISERSAAELAGLAARLEHKGAPTFNDPDGAFYEQWIEEVEDYVRDWDEA
jgi:hypothetical protein